jgi:3-dehydroquinate dehydratase-2
MKILIINGPNLNFLGARSSDLYGNLTLEDLQKLISNEFKEETFEFFQSNVEGEIINKIQYAATEFDALVINPGGFTHTSVAIRDAIEMLKIPKIEVHLSNLSKREEFRQKLITTSVSDGYISGFKELGYIAAIYLIKRMRPS